MGSAASLREGESVLCSVQDVETARFQDHFKKRLKRDEEILRRATAGSKIIGYQVTAPFAQPILKAKMDDLQSLPDVHAALCNDQRRLTGHRKVYLEQLAVGRNITAMAALDQAHLACASSQGQIWVYNWREDRIVSQLRNSSVTLADEDGNPEVCKVRRIQALTQDARLIGSTDERGMVCLWDLFTSSMVMESRFHEKACTSIKPDYWRQGFATTGEDSAVILYDLAQEQVRQRFIPAPRTCGSGVPNTCLGLGGDRFPNLLVTGGADGKLRLWDQAASLKRLHTIQIGSVLPTQAFACGWQLILSASFGDSSYSGMRPDRGGVYVYDLRMLAEGHDHRKGSLVVKYPSGVHGQKDIEDKAASSMRSSMKSSRSRGSARSAKSTSASRMATETGIGGMDLALVDDGGSQIAVSLMDSVVKTFDLGTGQEIPMDPERRPTRAPPLSEIDVVEQVDVDFAQACVVTAYDRYIFVASTAPTLSIWRRPIVNRYCGHSDFVPPEALPMELRLHAFPLALNANDAPHEALLADPTLRPGAVLSQVQEGLEADRRRSEMALR